MREINEIIIKFLEALYLQFEKSNYDVEQINIKKETNHIDYLSINAIIKKANVSKEINFRFNFNEMENFQICKTYTKDEIWEKMEISIERLKEFISRLEYAEYYKKEIEKRIKEINKLNLRAGMFEVNKISL